MPGLTEACTAAIRAQTAVNDLFARALKGSAPTPTSTAPSSAAAPTKGPRAVTKDDVAKTFHEVTRIIPPALATPFAALHRAADKITETANQDIPDVLAAAPVADAMKKITDYITDCRPPATD